MPQTHSAPALEAPTAVPFSILFQDERFVAIDKPAGYFVHRPEDASLHKFVDPEKIVLSKLRRQIGHYLYPAHRIDVATSGVLVFAKDPEAAKFFSFAMQEGKAQKTYMGVCRGWFPEPRFSIAIPLESDSSEKWLEAETRFEKSAEIECHPGVPGDKFASARYSLIRAFPVTGRYHQIRRHLNRVSHPLVGDNDHGDSRHNRLFRERFGIPGLCLRAMSLRLEIPQLAQTLDIVAPLGDRFEKLTALFRAG